MGEEPAILVGCCSDTHGAMLPRWGAQSITAVLHAGDVYDAPTSIDDDDDPAFGDWVKSLGVPVLAVKGNHDFRDPGQFFKAADDVAGRLHRLAPRLWIAGIGFAPKLHFDLPGESDLEPQCRAIHRQAQRQVMPGDQLILLTHYPPKLPELPCGDVPASWTYECVAELVDALRPVAVVQGHVHEWFGRDWRRGGILIVSPSPRGCILSIAQGGQATLVQKSS